MVHSESHKKALKDGLLTQKQYDKLPEALLDGIFPEGKKPVSSAIYDLENRCLIIHLKFHFSC